MWSIGCLNHSQVALAPAAWITLIADWDVISWAPLKAALGASHGPKGRIAPVGIFMAGINLSLEGWIRAAADDKGVMPLENTHHDEDLFPRRLGERGELVYQLWLTIQSPHHPKYRAKGSLWGSSVTGRVRPWVSCMGTWRPFLV